MKDIEYEKYLDLEDFLPENRVSILEYVCPLCKGVLLDPRQDKKGHVFCKRCIDKHILNSSKCPLDNHELTKDKLDSILFIINILDKQTVFCKNRVRDCEWKGNLKLLDSHLENQCIKQFLCCPNDGCQIKVIREFLNTHLECCNYRLVNCNYCFKDTCLQRLNIHYNDCAKYPLDCIQQCEKMIQRCEMDYHIKNQCENTLLNCPYNKFGCISVFLKKELKDHLMSRYDEHNFIIVNFYEKFQEGVLESINKSRINTNSLIEKISGAEKKINEITCKITNVDNNNILGKKISKGNHLITENKIIKRKKIEELDNKLIINY